MHLRLLLLLMVVTISCLATGQDAQSNLTPVQHKLLEASFEKVWRTVKKRHFDPKLGGLNWKKNRKEYRPRIIRAKTMNEGRAIINEILTQADLLEGKDPVLEQAVSWLLSQ